MKARISLGIALATSLAVQRVAAQETVEDARNLVSEWVGTQQIISKEKSKWQFEEPILNDTRNLLKDRIERLERIIEDLESATSSTEEERTGLVAEKERLDAASNVVESVIGRLETRIKSILQVMPEPLVSEIKPLARRIPDDPADAAISLGERVQNIVGILSQAEKFNSTITRTSESIELEDGRLVEVRTLYWGLAMAYYVDASSEYAGIGHPGEDGWEWPRIEGAGPDIRRLLDVYQGDSEIQFVEVPARSR